MHLSGTLPSPYALQPLFWSICVHRKLLVVAHEFKFGRADVFGRARIAMTVFQQEGDYSA